MVCFYLYAIIFKPVWNIEITFPVFPSLLEFKLKLNISMLDKVFELFILLPS